jgi:hypothetical protein
MSMILRFPAAERFMFFMVLFFSSLCTADQGPLPMQNRFPLHFQFLAPRPMSPEISEEGAWNITMALAYTSINFDHRHRQWRLLMDMELTTLDLFLSYGLTPRCELALEIPAVGMQDGFLDDFLETYHNTIGVANYDRHKRPKNTFGFDIAKKGQSWISGKSTGLAFTDSVVSIAYAWPEPCSSHHFRGKLAGRIKVPVGDSDLGLGSGKWDAGLYWAMGWRHEKWSFYIMPGYAVISDPNTRGADVSARNSASLFMGAAYRYNEDWQWIAQVNGYSSPVEETGIDALDNGSLELGFGFRYQLYRHHGLVFSFGEDLARAGPDFTVYFGWVWSTFEN